MSNCYECEYHKVDTYYGDILCRHVDNMGSINCPGAPRDCEFFKPLDIEAKIKDLESFERETLEEYTKLSPEIRKLSQKRDSLVERSIKIGKEIERLQKIQKEKGGRQMIELQKFDLETMLEEQKADPRYVYLAAPYIHADTLVVDGRVQAINRAAGELIGRGLFVFSPISHCHPIARAVGIPGTYDYWQGYNKMMLCGALAMVVLTLEGWRESTGIAGELEVAEDLDKPAYSLDLLDALALDQI